MNAERLLMHYEKIAEAPDAIARLRRFILDLAVHGKLVPQDANDEPASELLKRIAKEKARLVKAGEIRTPKAIPALSGPPFQIPTNWRWSQLAEIGLLSPRNEAPDALEASFVPMPLIAADYGVANQHEIRPWGEIKKGYTHFAEGDVGLAKITPCFENGKSAVFRDLTGRIGAGTTELHIVRPLFVDQDYILLFLKSPHFIETGIPKMTGTAGQKRVPTEYFALSPFPLPPLAEQHRIVAKVDELMGLCDRLEAAQAGREAVRDRLTAASLARLNESDLETFQADARFALGVLPAVTTRPDQIKALRRTILNLAVRGRLVPQDTKDEPASKLLKRIAMEKTGSNKPRLFPTADTLSKSDGFDPHLMLPIGWVWACLGEITHVGTGLTPSKVQPSYYDGGNIPWINSSATSADVIREAKFFVTPFAVKECRLKIYPAGSLVVALYGQGKTRGQVAELGLDATVNQACAVVQWLPSFHEMKGFVRLTLEQQYDAIRERAEGGPQPNLNVGKIKERLFPLPPLAEQRRIVARVDALMALCDRLEASLTAAAAVRRHLLDALLAEALAPGEDRELEAAE
ncbi:restriction endonuclease subunit S [Mesorhizobium sp. M8A.F.Ca.ET.173.01.1.1]|nr:restriction endonuclease subunit S [Mesorhizobium sp. M8A.F.Ca.ET.173.01.1.1]